MTRTKLFDFLMKEYGRDEPIIVDSVEYDGLSRDALRKAFIRMADNGGLKRFEPGVYYIPSVTSAGEKSALLPESVIERKYVSSKRGVFGLYSGMTLKHGLGLTQQFPFRYDVVSNNASARVRDVSVGYLRVRLRRARTSVTNENVWVLMLLELFSDGPLNGLEDYEKKRLDSFIREHDIKNADIFEYAKHYPAKTLKNMAEGGVLR